MSLSVLFHFLRACGTTASTPNDDYIPSSFPSNIKQTSLTNVLDMNNPLFLPLKYIQQLIYDQDKVDYKVGDDVINTQTQAVRRGTVLECHIHAQRINIFLRLKSFYFFFCIGILFKLRSWLWKFITKSKANSWWHTTKKRKASKSRVTLKLPLLQSQCCLLLFLMLVMDVSGIYQGPYTYSRVTSGICQTPNPDFSASYFPRRDPIAHQGDATRNKAKCDTAADAIGLCVGYDCPASLCFGEVGNADLPPGCVNTNQGGLCYNYKSGSSTACGYLNNACLCETKPCQDTHWREDNVNNPELGHGLENQCHRITICGNQVSNITRTTAAATLTSDAICSGCENGTWAASVSDDCQNCPAGKSSNAGSSSCEIICQAGKFSNVGSLCENCIAGQFSNTTGSSSCEICQVSKFSNADGSTSCENCPAGKSSPAGSVNCNTCPRGRYLINQASLDVFDCTICPAGQFQPTLHLDLSVTCQDCVGRYILDNSTKDTEHDSELDCKFCAAGTKFISTTTECKICGAGTYQAVNNIASVSCKSCPIGRYLDIINAGAMKVLQRYCNESSTDFERDLTKHDSIDDCLTCPKGFEINGTDTTQCFVCGWSKYQDVENVENVKCKTCLKNSYITDDRGEFVAHDQDNDCVACGEGQFAAAGDRACDPCAAGTEFNAGTSTCDNCIPGKYSTSEVPTCEFCPKGFVQATPGTPYCLPCLPGENQILEGKSSCNICPENTYSEETNRITTCSNCADGRTSPPGSTKCSDCVAGKFQETVAGSLEKICSVCVVGQFTNSSNLDKCLLCPQGYSQKSPKQTSCLPCIPGTYQDEEGKELCDECPDGSYQPDANKIECILLKSNNIAPQGGAATVEVPAGSFLTDCIGDTCRSFLSCPQGWIGSGDTREKECSECPAGQSSFKGSTECRTCAKGKFSNVEKSAICKDCPQGFYQPSDIKAEDALVCTKCPIGFGQEIPGSAICISNGGKTPKDCNDNEYFNASKMYDTDKPLGDCLDCPEGASCKGAIDETGVRSLFGWSRCSAPNELTFTKCKRPASCLGAPNINLRSKFPALAMNQSNESCAIGHVQNISLNLRCSRCAPNYAAPSGGSLGTCVNCKEQSGTIALVVLAAFMAIIFFIILIALKMKSRSAGLEKAEHSTLKRTLFTHLQMISIIMSLSVPWPDGVRFLLAIVSSLTSVSSHTSTVTCTSSQINLSQAEVFYSMYVVSVMLPLVMMLMTFFYWQFCATTSKKYSCGRALIRKSICPTENPFQNIKRGSKLVLDSKGRPTRSSRDGWILTNVLILYIFIPSIVKVGLQMFQSETICGVEYWALDDTIKYYSTSHRAFIFAVAVPSILFYGVVLIVLAFLYIGLHEDRQTNKKLLFRFGLLFNGFAPKFWWYEIVLFFRKLGVIYIVTFASNNEEQLHITLGLLVILLYLQEHLRPFDNPEASESDKIKNQRLHRMESFSLLVLIVMIWCAVFFVLGCDDKSGLCSVLGVSVILINVIFVGVVAVIFAQAWSKKKNLSKKFSTLADLLRSKTSKSRTSNSYSYDEQHRRQPIKSRTTVHELNPTMFPTLGESKIKCNPLARGKSKEEFKKQRRSIRTPPRPLHGTTPRPLCGGVASSELEMTTITEASNKTIEITVEVEEDEK